MAWLDYTTKFAYSFNGEISVDDTYIYGTVGSGTNTVKKLNKTSPYGLVFTYNLFTNDGEYASTIDDTHLYAGYGGNINIVQFLKSNGSIIGNTEGIDPSRIKSLAVDSTYIYVIRSTSNFVKMYRKTTPWDLIASFGISGSSDGQFTAPQGVAVDDNFIYVTDVTANRIQKFNKSTRAFVNKFSIVTPVKIMVDNNYIYVTTQDNYVKVFNKITYDLVTSFGGTGTGNGKFTNPIGIAINSNLLYVNDSGNNRVQIFNGQSFIYSQLERGTRGLNRGVFQGGSF